MVNNMEKQEYLALTKKYSPNENKLKNSIIAFIVGGLVGVFGQLLVDLYMKFGNVSYNEATSLMMVTLIFLTCLFTAIGFFDSLVSKAGAGLFIPISGFAHATTSSALEYKNEGLVMGIGSNIFKLSGSVILYGVLAAYIFGIVRFIFFGG
jgi:stage V sporulation protein AC